MSSNTNLIYDLKLTYHVDSFKLISYLSKCFNLENELEFESNNDMSYVVEVDPNSFYYDEDKEIEEAIKRGCIEEHYISNLIHYASKKEFLRRGTYAVNVSW